jgi:hypothetical protein
MVELVFCVSFVKIDKLIDFLRLREMERESARQCPLRSR